MPVSIRDAQHSPADRAWIQSQYGEYLEDLSRLSMNTGVFPAAGEYGERLRAAGAESVVLGDSVLRTSTAGPAAIAVLSARLGRW